MFFYDPNPSSPLAKHNWRPDLLPLILEWIENEVPKTVLSRHFRGFGVGTRGEVVARFTKRPAAGGPPRDITFKFDHTWSSFENEKSVWLSASYRVPFNLEQLTVAANHPH